MGFLHPWFLAGIVLFLLLLFFLKKIEERRYLDIPTGLIVRRLGRVKSFFKKSGRFFWFLAVLFLVVALARPQITSETEKIGVEGRMMILSIDLSTSMSGTYYSRANRPSVDVIKELSLEFVKKRSVTDLVGITAYGGRGSGRYSGEAAVIVFPTSEYAQLEASIKLLRPYMLGSHTSIGEGIFLSTLSLLDQDMLKDINIPELVKSLEGDRIYALNLVRKLGRFQFRNKIIILFTDGKNNAGIEPFHPLWFAKMLGIKFYFAALESSGPTGLSEEEQKKQKELLIQGVLETGGKYFEMNIVEQAQEFYNEIDRIETARLEILPGLEKKTDLYFWPVLIALMLIAVVILLESIFPRIQ